MTAHQCNGGRDDVDFLLCDACCELSWIAKFILEYKTGIHSLTFFKPEMPMTLHYWLSKQPEIRLIGTNL